MNDYISSAALYSPSESYLAHHGIKGQKWGVRRYQNEDGSLTPAGRSRYGTVENFNNAQRYKAAKKEYSMAARNAAFASNKDRMGRWATAYGKANRVDKARNAYKQSQKEYRNSPEGIAARKERNKKILKAGAIAAGTALAVYGTYKLNQKANKKVTEHYQKKGMNFLAKAMEEMNLGTLNMQFADTAKSSDARSVYEKAAYDHMNRAAALSSSSREWLGRADAGGYTLKEKYRGLRGTLN